MKQLVQRLRDGTMEVLEVTMPDLPSGFVLVQNHYSLISAGTEGGTVSAARKSLLGKARARPDQVKQVIASVKQQGLRQTYRAVSKKLDSYSSLGYSSAGVVLDVADDVRNISIGDSVACAGAGYAVHAEVAAVPSNLCVRLEDGADLELAAYNTLGAIALQGVRQADLRIGETCVVIGLGLLGQLTSLLLKASGVNVVGLDISETAVKLAGENCTNYAFSTSDPTLEDSVSRITNGVFADAAIVTAATSSLEPVNLSGRLLRKRGTVVIVGDVPTGFNREPDYYRKELSLKMSCSYGPGRYDPEYEEKGIDYPPGYVRWTENRNMRAFQELLHKGQIDIDYMTTHRFSIDDAPDAYDLVMNKTENYIGILIEYDASKQHEREIIRIAKGPSEPRSSSVGIGFIGAGSYAMSFLLPNLPRTADVSLRGVMTSSGTSSRSVAEKFGFDFVAASAQDVIGDKNTDTVFIATRHNSHAEYVNETLRVGKNVFVEKPLCLTKDELFKIARTWKINNARLLVGFNRRFSPLAEQIKGSLGSGVMSIVYRINSGAIAKESWVQDLEFGGGRIIGEVCHFVDFMVYLTGSSPTRVYASAMSDPSNLEDTVSITIDFSNGSVGTICYFSNGPSSLQKEYVEVFKGGMAARLFDFRELEIHGTRKTIRKKLLTQDKGQRAMVNKFISSIKDGHECPISPPEILATSLAAIEAVASLRSGQPIDLVLPTE